MSFFKNVKNKFTSSSSSSSSSKTKRRESKDYATGAFHSADTSSLRKQSSTNLNRNISLSAQSLNEKVNAYSFIKSRNPLDEWFESNSSNQTSSNCSEFEESNEFQCDKTFINYVTETKANCRLVKKFSNDCLDDYLVEIGILDSVGYKFQEYMAEINQLRQFKHKNLISFYDVYFYDSKLWIFTEYCGNASIGKLINDLEKPLSQIQIHYVVTEVLQGLCYLHEQMKMCHQDLRANNILITTGGDIKLANFIVWAKNNSDTDKKDYYYIKSPHWVAPEIAACEMSKKELNENFKGDIWSLGITCIEMACMYPPNSNLSAESVLLEISNSTTPLSMKHTALWSSNFMDFIQKCLDRNVASRPSALSLFMHPFISGHKVNRNEMKNLLDERKFKYYNETRKTIDELEQDLSLFKQMNQQPELYIYDYFQELRNQIDIESEKAKQYIESVQNDMIEALKHAEAECFANINKNSDDFHFAIKKNEEAARNELQETKDNETLEKEITDHINDWNKKLGARDLSETLLIKTKNDAFQSKKRLESRLDMLKSKLFLNKEYSFKANEKIEDFTCGKLSVENDFIEKKTKLAASAANNLDEDIDFKSNTISRKVIRLNLKNRRNDK